MPGVVEGHAQPIGDRNGFAVVHAAAETVQRVEHIDQGVERCLRRPLAAALRLPGAPARVLLLQVSRIEQHEAGEVAGRGGGDDLTTKALLHQQRQPPAMIEMRVGKQHEVDATRIEAERLGVLALQRAPALQQAAIDQDALAAGFEQVAGAGDGARGAVERQLHGASFSAGGTGSGRSRGVPLASYQRRMPAQMSSAVSANQNRSRSSGSIVPSATRKSASKARRQ